MDQIQKARDMETVKQAVGQFVAIPKQFLAQALGRDAELDELMEFVCMASAQFLGNMYGLVRKCASHEEGEKWLRKTLGLASAVVRMSGQDVILKFDVTAKIVPNTLHKPDPQKEAARAQRTLQKELGTIPPCTCTLDKDGRCLPCATKFSKHVEMGFDQLIKMQEEAEKEKLNPSCRACSESQFDYAISLLVPKLVKIGRDGQMGLALIYSIAQQAGGKPVPLTEKVWEEEMVKLKQASPSGA